MMRSVNNIDNIIYVKFYKERIFEYAVKVKYHWIVENDFTFDDVKEISEEVAESQSQQEAINEVDEYLDEQGLDSSSESMELLIAILKDGTK